jgi:uncharacterized protein (TIGR02145 family)
MQHKKVKLYTIVLFCLGLTGIQAQTVKDIDGNDYKTVTIGSQTWMAENLMTTRYNDGTQIPLVNAATEWAALTSPAYCNYKNTSNADTIHNYGRLYNWYTVNSEKVCPSGWHVPTDAEWTTLETFVGGISIAGNKLKETGTTHWQAPNGASGESMFSALPGGSRYSTGTFQSMGINGIWWNSTESDALDAWSRVMSYFSNSISRGDNYKSSGFSVRCIKD